MLHDRHEHCRADGPITSDPGKRHATAGRGPNRPGRLLEDNPRFPQKQVGIGDR